MHIPLTWKGALMKGVKMEGKADLADECHGDLRDERGQQDHKGNTGQDREKTRRVARYPVRQPLHPAVRLRAVHCLLHSLCTTQTAVRMPG